MKHRLLILLSCAVCMSCTFPNRTVIHAPAPDEVSIRASHNERSLAGLFDKSMDNRWTSGMKQEPGMELVLQFREPFLLRSLVLDADKSDRDYPRGYAVYVSDSGFKWGDAVQTGEGTTAVTTIAGLKHMARYIKIEQTGETEGLYWSVHDLKVNGKSLSQMKRVHIPEFTTFADMMVSLRGRESTRSPNPTKRMLRSGKVKLTSSHGQNSVGALFSSSRGDRWGTGAMQEPGMWFAIELPEPVRIRSLTMDHGRSDRDFPASYEVYFSMNANEWGKPVRTGKGSRGKTRIRGLKGTAKHIRIVQTGTNPSKWWSIYGMRINDISFTPEPVDTTGLWNLFPHHMVWLTQDAVTDREATRTNSSYDLDSDVARFLDPSSDPVPYLKQIMKNVMGDLGKKMPGPRSEWARLLTNPDGANLRRCFALYEAACMERRRKRLAPLLGKTREIIFAKRPVFGGIFYINELAGTNAVSELCLIDLSPELTGDLCKVSTLVSSEGGMMRNPDISYDGKRLLFAWRKTTRKMNNRTWAPDTGNYQIYEMDLPTRKVRQLTTDETYGANKEPIYLPNGDILFNSQRIVQHITCGWGDCSNFYVMDKDGKYQRRVSFDQTNVVDPAVSNDGTVLYLRRDYNDRGQTGAHALFQMNIDGTAQTEYYGNQTGSPNSFQRPAAIPGSNKIFIILGGYHTTEGGQLGIMDVRKGRQNGDGIVRVPQGDAPSTSPRGNDRYAKYGIQYTCPRALSEDAFVVCRSETWGRGREKHRIYFMMSDGSRELLASARDTSCMDPVLVMPRKLPPVRPAFCNYKKKMGAFYVQDVYVGGGTKGLKRGSVKRLRVVELLYKHDTIRSCRAAGPGGGDASVMSPGHGLSSFDAKRILGSATVHRDGSAMFEVPSRKPVYFQLLDEQNRVVQTMRSWTTLMPGERFSCVGCHEDKNDTPAMGGKTIAMGGPPEKLKPFYGDARPFSYLQEVQPVFDKHCVSCHKPDGKGKKLDLRGTLIEDKSLGRKFATSYVKLTAPRPGPAPDKFRVIGSAIAEWNRSGPARKDEPNKYVTYWTRLGTMGPIPPKDAGSIKSGLVQQLEAGHVKDLPQEALDKIKAWIDLNLVYVGDYREANLWSKKEVELYDRRIVERLRNEAIEAKAIEAFIKDGQP